MSYPGPVSSPLPCNPPHAPVYQAVQSRCATPPSLTHRPSLPGAPTPLDSQWMPPGIITTHLSIACFSITENAALYLSPQPRHGNRCQSRPATTHPSSRYLPPRDNASPDSGEPQDENRIVIKGGPFIIPFSHTPHPPTPHHCQATPRLPLSPTMLALSLLPHPPRNLWGTMPS